MAFSDYMNFKQKVTLFLSFDPFVMERLSLALGGDIFSSFKIKIILFSNSFSIVMNFINQIKNIFYWRKMSFLVNIVDS